MSTASSNSLYELQQLRKLKAWQRTMKSAPGLFNKLTARVQKKINAYIPQKVHDSITLVIKKMIEGVLFTSEFIKPAISQHRDLEDIERSVTTRLEYYRSSAAVEGGVTGFSGILGSLADFPILIGIKIKFLFDVAAVYGYDTSDLKERVYLLHIFQLAFSNPTHRAGVFQKLAGWASNSETIPGDIHGIDWQNFQQQYRDYIDLAKMAQMLPGIGAAVGLVVNYRLLNQLGNTAIMCYRMRWFAEKKTNEG
jgi:hypothetical protein